MKQKCYLLCEFLADSMVRSSVAVHDFRRSLLRPIGCCVDKIPLLTTFTKSGNDGHDENNRDAFYFIERNRKEK